MPKTSNIVIDPEFQAVLPPLDDDERAGLERMILAEGCRDPLVTWGGILIDGHNRYAICTEHGLPFSTVEREFSSREAARIWMRENQNSRRNLNAAWRIEMALADKADLAKVGAAKYQQTVGRPSKEKSLSHGDSDKSPAPKHNTRAEIAAKSKTSTGQVAMAEVVRREDPEMWEQAKTGDITVTAAYKEVKKKKKKEARAAEISQQREAIERGEAKLPEGKFEVVVIDPPWAYGREYDPDGSRVANPYPEMSQSDLMALQPPFADDAVVFLWTTHQFIWDAKALLDHWSFNYKATLVWDKEKIGMGSWLRMQCEFCLVGVRGKPVWQNTTWRDVIREPRREHSRKPDTFYRMVEECTTGRRLEMFAREQRKGWGAFGNDTEKF